MFLSHASIRYSTDHDNPFEFLSEKTEREQNECQLSVSSSHVTLAGPIARNETSSNVLSPPLSGAIGMFTSSLAKRIFSWTEGTEGGVCEVELAPEMKSMKKIAFAEESLRANVQPSQAVPSESPGRRGRQFTSFVAKDDIELVRGSVVM